MGVIVPTPVVGVDVPNHVTDALGRLLEQDKNKTNVTALLTALVTSVQDLESALWQLLTQRRATTAIGSQLDAIGKLVNQARLGFDDVAYARLISARIVANVSRGRYEDLIAIAKTVVNDSTTTEQAINTGIATAVMRILGNRIEWQTGSILISMLRDASSCRVLLEFLTYPAVVIAKIGASGAWDAGASSVETFAADGVVTVTTLAPGSALQRIVGLTDLTPTGSFDIKWSWYFCRTGGNTAEVSQTGSIVFATTFAAGDVFEVRRIGSSILYLKNGVIQFTSATTSISPLRIDTSYFTTAAAAVDVRLYDAGKRKPITWQNVVNVTVTPPIAQPYAQRARFADATIYAAGSGGWPQTAAQVTAALAGLGNFTGGAGWLLDELSGNAAAVFGSPTLTANGSPLYANPGPRGFSDKAIAIDIVGTDYLDGGNVYDVSGTDDLAVVWGGKFAAAPTGVDLMISKGAAADTNAWAIFRNNGAVVFRFKTGGVTTDVSVSFATLATEPHVGIATLDRGTGKARIGLIGLTSGTVALSTDTAVSGTLTNANTFRIGAQTGFGANTDTAYYSGLYVVKGSSVASGLNASLSNALTAFANKLNAWPYLRAGAVPSYGNGFEDAQLKYPEAAAAMAAVLKYGVWANGSGFLCNETSGNLAPVFGATTLTATTLVYSIPGPRGGTDTAIGFSAGGSNASHATLCDVAATDDLCIAALMYVTGAPGAEVGQITKFGGAGPTGWFLQLANNGKMHFGAYKSGGVQDFITADVVCPFNDWFVMVLAIDRATGKACLGVQSLRTGSQAIAAQITATASSYSTTSAFRLGQRGDGGIGASAETSFAGVYGVAGSGVAAGIPANMSAALSNLAAQINRYYGGNLSAAME